VHTTFSKHICHGSDYVPERDRLAKKRTEEDAKRKAEQLNKLEKDLKSAAAAKKSTAFTQHRSQHEHQDDDEDEDGGDETGPHRYNDEDEDDYNDYDEDEDEDE